MQHAVPYIGLWGDRGSLKARGMICAQRSLQNWWLLILSAEEGRELLTIAKIDDLLALTDFALQKIYCLLPFCRVCFCRSFSSFPSHIAMIRLSFIL